MNKKRYCVYKHTFPNGRVYIGITNRNPLERWQGGNGYKGTDEMYDDIMKYGWKNIRHEILDEGLSHEKALEVEKGLIREEELRKRGNTYNTQQTSEKVVYSSFWDMPVTETNIRTHKQDFLYGIDAWFDNNQYFPDGMYEGAKMTSKSLSFPRNLRVNDDGVFCDEMCFIYPKEDIRFDELRDWIFAHPKPTIIENVKYF